jgi:hypothetical protein
MKKAKVHVLKSSSVVVKFYKCMYYGQERMMVSTREQDWNETVEHLTVKAARELWKTLLRTGYTRIA